jgi:hypothetical protein
MRNVGAVCWAIDSGRLSGGVIVGDVMDEGTKHAKDLLKLNATALSVLAWVVPSVGKAHWTSLFDSLQHSHCHC